MKGKRHILFIDFKPLSPISPGAYLHVLPEHDPEILAKFAELCGGIKDLS
jgi:hypothetical protein